MLNTVFIGPPGSGKGSQAKLVVARYGLEHISTGELLRHAADQKTELGLKAAKIMSRGDLVPDELVVSLIGDQLGSMAADAGFILDGFPRTDAQARALQDMLARLGRPLDFVLHLHVALEAVVTRLSGRRACANCGEIYNIHYKPTKVAGICDVCGHTHMIQRPDDNETSIRQRLGVYSEQTSPLLAYYEELGLLRTISASGTAAEVAELVDEAIRPFAA